MVKGVRHCSTARECCTRGFNPHRRQNILWIMSPLWSKRQVSYYRLRENNGDASGCNG